MSSGDSCGILQGCAPLFLATVVIAFPTEIISHCIWLYFRFSVSFRDVEEILAMRGVSLSCETVREWCLKFDQAYANSLRRRSPRLGDRWHLDEVFLRINGQLHYLWRAVDQDRDVLDILVQSHRDKKATKKFYCKLLKDLRYVPSVIGHRQAEGLQYCKN
jgi:putative transposase